MSLQGPPLSARSCFWSCILLCLHWPSRWRGDGLVGSSWVPCKVISFEWFEAGAEEHGVFRGSVSAGRSIVVIKPSTISKATAKEVPSAVTWLIHPSEVEIGDAPEVTGMPTPPSQLPGQARDQLMELVFKAWMNHLHPGPQRHLGMVQTHSGTVNANRRSDGASPGSFGTGRGGALAGVC